MMYKSIITLALTLSLTLAQAQQIIETPELPYQGITKSTKLGTISSKEQPFQATFGTYATIAGLSAAPANTVVTAETVATLGAHTVYANPGQTKPSVVRQNTVVRNLISGKLAIVTGNISVLTKDVEALDAAALKLGLQQLKRLRNGQVQLLQAGSDTDLLSLRSQLLQVRGVKTVKLDVLENRFSAQ